MGSQGATEVNICLEEFCGRRGLHPGVLLTAKEDVILQMTFEDLREVMDSHVADRYYVTEKHNVIKKGVSALFVGCHSVRLKHDGSWDFWYEILLGERTAYVDMFAFGAEKLRRFDVRSSPK